MQDRTTSTLGFCPAACEGAGKFVDRAFSVGRLPVFAVSTGGEPTSPPEILAMGSHSTYDFSAGGVSVATSWIREDARVQLGTTLDSLVPIPVLDKVK